MSRVSDLQGLWSRSLLAWPDGRRDTTTRVHWLQGASYFADLRQPTPFESFEHAQGLGDLTLNDCARLSQQQGFAGELTFDGSHFEWRRRIDYQPARADADAGSLRWEENVLIEEGRDIEYVEHWHRASDDPRAPVAGAVLRDRQNGVQALFLQVGCQFMFARDRSHCLPAGAALLDCVLGASNLAEAQAVVDCEISRGVYETGRFNIVCSTLPYRIGADLTDQVKHRWQLVDQEGDTGSICHILGIIDR